MSDRARGARAALFVLLAGSALAGAAPAPPTPPPWADELLRQSDVGGFAPRSFRARMRLAGEDRDGRAMAIEVWRRGAERTLVRFLDPKERGKYLLRRGDDLWFLAPGAKKPVRLKPSYRLRGNATLDDVLGLRHADGYAIAGVKESTGPAGERQVEFDLVARSKSASYARVLYVVRPDLRRPVRAEYLLPSGRVASEILFLDWAAGRRAWATHLLIRDRLRGGRATDVRVLELEERDVPEALFSLDDAGARRALEAG